MIVLATFFGCRTSSNEIVIKKTELNHQPIITEKDFNDFFENISRLQLATIDTAKLDSSYKSFYDGFNAVLNSKLLRAKNIFKELLLKTDNKGIEINSKKILSDLFFNASQWDELIKLFEKIKLDAGENNNFELIKAFNESDPETYHFADDDIILPISLSKSGTPIITAKVNGNDVNFWIDTGAELSVLASDIAEQIGIKQIGKSSSKAMTATSKKINFSPAVIDSLEIGTLKIKNHPILILQKEDLEFSLLAGLVKIKIDGIIGWNAIRNLSLSINFPGNLLTIKKPIAKKLSDKNFFWLGYPFITLTSEEGIPLCFGLDTGAKNSILTKNIFSKIDFEQIESTNESIGGAGGFENVTVDLVSNFKAILNNHQITINDIKVFPPKSYSIIKHDGIIGSDLLKNAVVEIDYQNGMFEINFTEEK